MHRHNLGIRTLISLSFALTLIAPLDAVARTPSEVVADYAPLRIVAKPQTVSVSSQAPEGYVVVKFRRDAVVTIASSRLGGVDAVQVSQIVGSAGLPSLEPIVRGDVNAIQRRRVAAEDRQRANLPDMSLYFRTPVTDPGQAASVIGALNALDAVELAYFSPKSENAAFESASTVPSYEYGQTYLNAAPQGVDSRAAWTLPGGDGTGITVIDVEQGWTLNHEDLSKGASAILVSGNMPGDDEHGTAVLGEMFADHNGTGMSGMLPGGACGVSQVEIGGVAGAISDAVPFLNPGDIILIEQHAPGPRYDYEWRDDQEGYVPMEFFQAEFDAMVNAWAAGIIVCEAAGNGAEDLDDTLYGPLFDTTYRNSHAIMCGAGYPPFGGNGNDRSKLDFSNWGERVNLQGYGVAVYTLGYGDLYDGGTYQTEYTSQFSGTSSASPIVTGAVASLSGIFKNMLGTVLDADAALHLLEPVGSPQTIPFITRHIGPRPDLYATIAPLFDPIDSIFYGDVNLCVSEPTPFPITLSNSHPVGTIYLPFKLTGPAPIYIDSLTRAQRTKDFEQISLIYDNRYAGEIGYSMRADAGGGTPELPGGTGTVAYLWVHTNAQAQLGQVEVVDSAWFGSSTRLRLTSVFDDGYPDYFQSGTITISTECGGQTECFFTCPHQGDVSPSGSLDALDLNVLISIIFFGAADIQDAGCPISRSDVNGDGFVDALDLNVFINHLFFGGPVPCDPCFPGEGACAP